MERALSTITVFPDSQLEIAQFTRRIKAEILVSKEDPLKILKQLKYVEKAIKELLTDKELEEHFRNEHSQYGEKTVEHIGCKFTEQETGVRYDFHASGDPIWEDMNKRMVDLKLAMKNREAFLVKAQDGFVEPISGVFVTAPVRTSKTKIAVSLLK